MPINLRRSVELGCGVAPAAGMTCLALGAAVYFTDLAEVLPFVEANVRLNGDRISTLRARAGHAPLSRSSCDTEAYRFGRQSAASASQSRLASLARAPRGFDLILASDCIFRSDLHTPLAQTLRQLFDYDAAGRGSRPISQVRCIVAFRYREAADLEFFTDALPRRGSEVVGDVNAVPVPAAPGWLCKRKRRGGKARKRRKQFLNTTLCLTYLLP